MEREQLANLVGQAIRARRRETGASQDSFADRIGMHRAYFAAIERGEKNVTLATLRRIADGLGCSCWLLLSEADI